MRKKILFLLLASAVAAAGLFYMMSFVLPEGKGALVVTFGSPTERLLAPDHAGLHVKWPWPVQKVFFYDLRERLFTGPLIQVSDAEGSPVVVGAFATWHVADPQAFHEKIGNTTLASTFLETALSSGLNKVFGQYRYTDLVRPAGGGGGDGTGTTVLKTMEKVLSGGLNRIVEQYGMRIAAVGFHRLMLTPGTSKGVFDMMREAKKRDATGIEKAGEAEAGQIQAEANRDYERALAKARTDAAGIVSEARSKAAGILAAVPDKDLLTFLDKLDTLKEFLAGETTWVVDTRTLPLDLLEEIKPAPVKAVPVHSDVDGPEQDEVKTGDHEKTQIHGETPDPEKAQDQGERQDRP